MLGAKTLLLLSFALLASLPPARAEEQSEVRIKGDSFEGSSTKPWQGNWNLELGGASFSEGKDQGAAAYTYLNVDVDWTFTSWLKAKINPVVGFYSSRVQERYDNDDYNNNFHLADSYLSVKPVEFVELRAGAIGQEFLGNEMLVYGWRSFPGFQGRIEGSFAPYKAALVAEEVVPTSYSLNTEREEKESLPIFTTQSIQASGKNFSLVEWKVNGGHFTWSNLPDKVAFESAQLGNSVIGDVAPGARFRYQFDGFFGGAEICACWDYPVQLVGEYSMIDNTKAASGFGDAEMVGIGPRIIWGEHQLDVRYSRYFIEKDATVADYNRSFLGNNNRMGDEVRFKLDFKHLGFALFGDWVNAVPIRDNQIQQTFTAVKFGVETRYAPF